MRKRQIKKNRWKAMPWLRYFTRKDPEKMFRPRFKIIVGVDLCKQKEE